MTEPTEEEVRGKSLPPFERISGAYIDHENKTFVIVTKDLLINQLQRDCPEIALSFDAALGPSLGQVSEILAEITTMSVRHILGQDLSDQSRSATCARLLNTALSTFVGCIHLARGGFRLQYMTLVRSVVETICTALHLMVDPKALEEFHAGKLRSTRSIGAANKILPGFGRLWGDLSNQFVHITTMHSDLNPVRQYKGQDDDLITILMNMKIVVWLMLVTAELVFVEELEHPRHWKIVSRRTDGNEIAYDPSDEVRAFDATFFGEVLDKA